MKLNLYFFSFLILILCSCEDPINIDVQNGQKQVVVDAWLTNKDTLQTISLTYSQGYFDSLQIKGISGATVKVRKDSLVYEFKESATPGQYVYDAKKNRPFTEDHKPYILEIVADGETYNAKSYLKRVPPIDSLKYESYKPPFVEKGKPKSGFQAEFYAVDPVGLGDTYWIKTTINDTLYNKPSVLNIAFDAGFSPGSLSDGLLFILPIRQRINTKLIQDKDKVKVEIYSITNEAFDFLQSVFNVNNNSGLFDVPPANLPTNIYNVKSGSKVKPIGFFNLSAVSKFETVIDSKKAKPLNPNNK